MPCSAASSNDIFRVLKRAAKPLAIASILAVLAPLAACTAAAPADAKEASPLAPSGGKPAGKISPEMVGRLSPIPAFKGQGDGWRVEIRALDATQHHVALQWPASGETATGTARYDGPLNVAREAGPLILNGALERGGAKRPLRVEIRAQACVDRDGIARPHTIAIAIGAEPPLHGCGDLAMY